MIGTWEQHNLADDAALAQQLMGLPCL